ncbi:MAG: TIGR00269 family protein [Candidatus Heimdallarchaeota archaeon]|nr:TIGR00269 family protein [Candidatus Heimdallarchaeota archaeon]
MKFPQCTLDNCVKKAIWQRPWDKTYLCLMHFNQSFLRRVQRTINEYKLFERDDIIAIGVSGGKDSIVLLDVMVKLQENYPTKVIAISIDEGIRNYREDGLKFAKMAVERYGVDHHTYSFKDQFGYELDDALVLLGDSRRPACSYCGPFRRKALNDAAKEVGATKLVTGHNADDEAQTVLMNLMRGDLLKTLHSNPRPEFKHPDFVNRVKPFRKTTEQEIVLYANLNNLPYQEESCPHAVEAYRGYMKDILTEYMEHDPSVLFSIIRSSDSLHHLGRLAGEKRHKGNKTLTACLECGDPSNSSLCGSCKIINELNSREE